VVEDATVQITTGEIGVCAFVSLLASKGCAVFLLSISIYLYISSNAFSGSLLHCDRLLDRQMLLKRKISLSTGVAAFLLLMV
jgi:hypothetical protein